MTDTTKAAGDGTAPETVASATECTGLMPALPENHSQDAASAALYGVHAAKATRGKRYRRK